MPTTVEVLRGHIVESRHRVSLAVVRSDGKLVAASGDPGLVTYWRSAAKFLQAIPLVADGASKALSVDDEELSLACASHNGEPRHVQVARRLLARSGAGEADLVCGPHSSLNEDVARAMRERGEKPSRVHSNCSGKHAAMIALARWRGWGSSGYEMPEHPLQRRCLEEVSRWCGLETSVIPCATDGCGVPSFALPLRSMALAFARLAAADAGHEVPEVGEASAMAARCLFGAVRSEPFLIAGTGRLDTDLIMASGGRVIAKVGAEGVYCAAVPSLHLGIALKVEDGATRAQAPVLLGLLGEVAPGLAPGLEDYASPTLTNSRGLATGRIVSRVELDRLA